MHYPFYFMNTIWFGHAEINLNKHEILRLAKSQMRQWQENATTFKALKGNPPRDIKDLLCLFYLSNSGQCFRECQVTCAKWQDYVNCAYYCQWCRCSFHLYVAGLCGYSTALSQNVNGSKWGTSLENVFRFSAHVVFAFMICVHTGVGLCERSKAVGQCEG